MLPIPHIAQRVHSH